MVQEEGQERCVTERKVFSVTVGGVLCVQQVPGEMFLLSQDSEMILQQVRFCFQIFIDTQLKTNYLLLLTG